MQRHRETDDITAFHFTRRAFKRSGVQVDME